MSRLGNFGTRSKGFLARELLEFYDDLTAHNACIAFVTQALATALMKGNELDERSATGAIFCAQWLDDRASELEQKLKSILSKARSSTTTG